MHQYFIYDPCINKKITFEEFIESLNSFNNYFEAKRFDNFIDFILNLTFALVNNLPICLLDKDFKNTEIDSLGIKNIENNNCNINNPIKITNKEMLVSSLRNSRSIITIFTSGTTGIPKKIEHKIESLTRMTKVNLSHKDDIWALCYNPTHMAGLQVLFQALFNLNTFIYLFETPFASTESILNSEKVTHISATPTYYRLLVASDSIYPLIQRVTLGGEKSDNKLYMALKCTFPNAKFNNIYASTELGPLFNGNSESFIVPEKLRNCVKIGLDNELLIHKDIAGGANIIDNWYSTGDLVEVISENPLIFIFSSRKNEMINTGGNKVNPLEVEEYIYKINGIISARVFGLPNSVLGNIICAEIVLNKNFIISENDIKEFLLQNLQDFKIPRIIKFVNKIQETRTGKISRK